jgi:uncharacterized protein
MPQSLPPIHIPQLLRAPERTDEMRVKDYLPDLETLMPIQGVVRVIHQTTYLEVVAQAETIVTLTCDRCLKQYNQRLKLDVSEMIWLSAASEESDSPLLEKETLLDDLVESLPPDGYFDPAAWLYEQLCLALPQQQLCDAACPGIPLATSPASESVDHRWASLAQLKSQIDSQSS